MLLAITNDAWYGRTGAPYQFLAITALRSAETGVWTARAANTGVSAFIDGQRPGAANKHPSSSGDSLVTDVPLPVPGGGRNFLRAARSTCSQRACGIVFVLLAAFRYRRSRSERLQ